MPKKIQKIELIDLSEAYQKVLYWFFSFPNIEMSLNDLVEELAISKTTANKIVHLLEEEGFLKKKIYGRTWRITCNQNHRYNFQKKISFNLEMIYDLYNNGLRELILSVVENPQSIVLFGSYRKGDDTEESDIDIAVEVIGNDDLKILPIAMIPDFGFRKNVPVNLHIFTRNKVDINLFSNIANGIVLEGFLEVRP